MYVSSGQASSGIFLNDNLAWLGVYGVADHTVVSRGTIDVFSGGRAQNTTINYGRMSISRGGIAVNTGVSQSGNLVIYRGGYTSDTRID